MKIEKLISADSHVVEPPDLWQERMDARFRHRAPRMIHDNGIDRWIVDESIAVGSTGAPSQAGRRYEDKESLSIEAAFADTPKAAWDPDARVAASELDGVSGEVVFPTIAVRMVETDIASDLLSACFRAANDWMADFCGAHPKRLKGTCLLNVDDIDEAVAELERCLRKGAAAACIPAYPGEGRTYDLPRCERLWAAGGRPRRKERYTVCRARAIIRITSGLAFMGASSMSGCCSAKTRKISSANAWPMFSTPAKSNSTILNSSTRANTRFAWEREMSRSLPYWARRTGTTVLVNP